MHRIRSWARARAYGAPVREHASRHGTPRPNPNPGSNIATPTMSNGAEPEAKEKGAAANADANLAPTATANDTRPATENATRGDAEAAESGKPPRPGLVSRVAKTARIIIFGSWANVLLVFVPVGVAVHFAHAPAGVVFAMNAIAIVPLAGLLGKATETVAAGFGDAIGALMNVTFGNAVELIIFIALVKNEIRIVQASLLGSILANLLLILGMCFCFGGLRFREQIYNSTVTQMSACLLCLAVMSLLLPTAFHASFKNMVVADEKVLQVSRGVSVILLLVYVLYLVFQLNSHAYLYESTPQHIIEREAHPGPAAQMFDSSSSSDSDSSSSDSDSSSSSSSSGGKREKVKRAFTSRRRRRQSDSTSTTPGEEGNEMKTLSAIEEGEGSTQPKKKKRHHRKSKHRKKKAEQEPAPPALLEQTSEITNSATLVMDADVEAQDAAPSTKPFALRVLRPVIPRGISQTVFNHPHTAPNSSSGTDLRRSRSMPERTAAHRVAPGEIPRIVPIVVTSTPRTAGEDDDEDHSEEISRTSAIILLLVSTGLVALCAEFLVASIDEVVAGNSALSKAFIGLILLPIVGNAAEHVTAVTVAMKNKMDLAIGVAVGSSIQIALFVTPLVVILGWIMNKEMSLYFTLFETVSLFVSTFIVNFLVLDGRSNYLEGALLMSAYVIIAVAAFFYPSDEETSEAGGGDTAGHASEAAKLLVRGVGGMVGF
ncbi:Sodium/calcium exchanger protein-domain-containing protein [Cercophora newfieldiana]|uniref:Sodium/calcium exchanger protein-domain-containing protein n=1 Tax=Cercophora newfieldiana TaxID=92897 RepID=A0AA39YC89_9PEZI|nr:Sodium/calcium exchanger protein-domain-containing protein [Cercophora newfieldiana]